MPRPRLFLAMVGLVLACATPARAAEGPTLSVPAKDLAAALDCPTSLAGATRAPVLLVPGTNLEPKANFDWNYEPALTAAGIPWCAVTLPRYALSDIQVAAEYVVHAVREMRSRSGRRVSVVGWSQGGMISRWATKWWPDTRGMLEDLVGLAPSNHGTAAARRICVTSCPPAFWQQRDDAKFIAALNAGGETFTGTDYTVAYTHGDEIVTPNADEATGSSPLRTGSGAIRNIALQDICPSSIADHFALGSSDPVGWAIALDALTHTGPADPARLDRAVCAQALMPGVDPATFPVNFARLTSTLAPSLAQSEYVAAEPPLKCYASASCPAGSGTPSSSSPRVCSSRRSFVIHLPRRFRSARVRVGGRAVNVKRRGGRLTARVDLRGRLRSTVRVQITGRSGNGRSMTTQRSYRTCGVHRGSASVRGGLAP